MHEVRFKFPALLYELPSFVPPFPSFLTIQTHITKQLSHETAARGPHVAVNGAIRAVVFRGIQNKCRVSGSSSTQKQIAELTDAHLSDRMDGWRGAEANSWMWKHRGLCNQNRFYLGKNQFVKKKNKLIFKINECAFKCKKHSLQFSLHIHKNKNQKYKTNVFSVLPCCFCSCLLLKARGVNSFVCLWGSVYKKPIVEMSRKPSSQQTKWACLILSRPDGVQLHRPGFWCGPRELNYGGKTVAVKRITLRFILIRICGPLFGFLVTLL